MDSERARTFLCRHAETVMVMGKPSGDAVLATVPRTYVKRLSTLRWKEWDSDQWPLLEVIRYAMLSMGKNFKVELWHLPTS